MGLFKIVTLPPSTVCAPAPTLVSVTAPAPAHQPPAPAAALRALVLRTDLRTAYRGWGVFSFPPCCSYRRAQRWAGTEDTGAPCWEALFFQLLSVGHYLDIPSSHAWEESDSHPQETVGEAFFSYKLVKRFYLLEDPSCLEDKKQTKPWLICHLIVSCVTQNQNLRSVPAFSSHFD